MDLEDPQIRRLMETLRAEVASGSPAGALFGESIGMALSAHIAERYSAMKTKVEACRGGLGRPQLGRVLEFIEAHLADDLQLAGLAEIAGVNMFHFAKAFKQSVGASPHQYVLRRRIERAKEFLSGSEVSVIEASARTGFVDQSHFSKVFRRLVGVAPSEYRRNI
jgi:AraC family transcriptional regulator